MFIYETYLLIISTLRFDFHHVAFLDVNESKTDLAYNRRLPDRRNLLRHRQRGLGGHEQCRMCLLYGDVSYVHCYDAYDINM